MPGFMVPFADKKGLQENNYGNALPVRPNEGDVMLLRYHGPSDAPRTLSVGLAYRLFDDELGNYDVAPVCTVNFGVGGANYEVDMDMPLGSVFNLTASSLDIRVRNPSPLEPDEGLPGRTILAQATISEGAVGRASPNPARLTIRLGDIPADQGVLIPIPAFATSYNVMTTSPTPALGNLRATQSLSPANTIPLAVTQSNTFDLAYSSVPIIQGARALEIYNTNVGDALRVRVVFTLSF